MTGKFAGFITNKSDKADAFPEENDIIQSKIQNAMTKRSALDISRIILDKVKQTLETSETPRINSTNN